jgi:diguanylate cyclase (GGDEF)-like protein
MQVVNLIDINVLALVFLAFLFFDARKRIEKPKPLQDRLYLNMAFILALLLIIDSLGRVFDGYNGEAYYLVNLVSNTILYILVPIAPSCWALYAIYQVFRDEKRLKTPKLILALICIANALLTVISLFTGWYFAIDGANVYHRGPLFWLHMSISFAIVMYPLVVLIRNKDRVDRKRFSTLMLFPVPTVIGGVLQTVFYGTSLIWCCMTVSVLIIYLNIQAERLGTDYLTGVNNRRLLDRYINDKIEQSTPEKVFSAILIDLDNFKRINDTFGHDVGDEALLDTVNLLRNCLRNGDFISRYGGDEFLIVLDISSQVVLEETVKRLKDCFSAFNLEQSKPYSLSFSTGCAVYDRTSGMDPEQFIKHIDMLMYNNKKKA